jgi:hypothetical protein
MKEDTSRLDTGLRQRVLHLDAVQPYIHLDICNGCTWGHVVFWVFQPSQLHIQPASVKMLFFKEGTLVILLAPRSVNMDWIDGLGRKW